MKAFRVTVGVNPSTGTPEVTPPRSGKRASFQRLLSAAVQKTAEEEEDRAYVPEVPIVTRVPRSGFP